MKFLRLMLIVFAIGFSSNSNAVPYTVMGVRSCGNWNEDRAEQSRAEQSNSRLDVLNSIIVVLPDTAWLMGYLSGIAESEKKNFLENVSGESLIFWINNYCQKNPLDKLDDAANVLVKELIKRMH